MIVSLVASEAQIRWYVEQAINGFETLESKTAISEALSTLQDLLTYLENVDRANDPAPIFSVVGGKSTVRIKPKFRHRNR